MKHLLPVIAVGAALLVSSSAVGEVYRVKVKFVWLPGTDAPLNVAPPRDQVYFADCPQSPRGHNIAWVERNCLRVAGIFFNPSEISVTKQVPWQK